MAFECTLNHCTFIHSFKRQFTLTLKNGLPTENQSTLDHIGSNCWGRWKL